MNPSLKWTVGDYFMVPCPKCGKGHFLAQWGKQKCNYEGCDGHEWEVHFDLELARLMLKEIEEQHKQEAERLKTKSPSQWIPPRWQRINDGWIMVPQVTY